ncbi:metal-dependent hydrolase [Natranaeroarchaeum sulfidigenes]|uniref:Putative membrane-bound metal-dependent hydrolase n=1 Tax=Natranaeroarchaeum sulfidigenes TaxID=2784880 RepID=A0A897MKD4_9EURY|nr:metal-dependent hydrolase [Natranaeroarchaeum sulfidigenes]QSG02570.1 putative membrane-bound metal-dependent hydrolase [Natranaeroarchaeum sulfidigenes]
MMLTTHVLAGLALALPVVVFVPELAPAAVVAGGVGGAFPDFDMYFGHRRTFHFPVYYTALAVPAVGVAVTVPQLLTITVAVGLAAAALHCLMDIFGGGLELRPWEGRSERAVYDHYHGRWIAPRRLIRYDGSPEDLLLAGGFAVPTVLLLDGPVVVLVAVLLGISFVYVVLRRWLADLAPTVFSKVPEPIEEYVPDRYLE